MANASTAIVATQVTVTASSVAISRGTRLTLGSDGTCAVSAIGVRGDYVALIDIAANGVGVAAPASSGSVPVVASENCTRGDIAYSAASGQVSKTSTNAIVMGRWKDTTVSGTLGRIELESVS